MARGGAPFNSKKRHRSGNPEADGYDLSSIVTQACKQATDGGVFSGEEVLGKYLDLTQLHDLVSQKHLQDIFQTDTETTAPNTPLSYVEFLSILTKGLANTLSESKKLKHRKKYVKFLSLLKEYLVQFFKKTSPLLHLEKEIIQPLGKQFQTQWKHKGGITGWELKPAEKNMSDNATKATATTSTHAATLDLTPYHSPTDLEQAVDKDVLKVELSLLGLKCGGTPLERAKRLFLTKHTPVHKLPKKLLAKKTTTTTTTNDNNHTHEPLLRRVDVAYREAVVAALLQQLRPTLDATTRRAERRLAQTTNERERENYEEVYGAAVATAVRRDDDDSDSDSDDSDTPIYNPKGVPLGWDGKPIPYWLFKLHGLNHFFSCEICGNVSYRGRRNFEKHFTETRHAHGMRCLGIPNTRHFHGVTKMEDAHKLWASLRKQMEQSNFDGSKDEEYEDSNGNVLNRGEYEDLARQGLL